MYFFHAYIPKAQTAACDKLNFKFLSDVWVPQPISKAQETHSGCGYLRSSSFGHYPKLLSICEGSLIEHTASFYTSVVSSPQDQATISRSEHCPHSWTSSWPLKYSGCGCGASPCQINGGADLFPFKSMHVRVHRLCSDQNPARLLCSEALQNKFCWISENIAGICRRAGHAGQEVGCEDSLKHLEIFQNKHTFRGGIIFNSAKMPPIRDINIIRTSKSFPPEWTAFQTVFYSYLLQLILFCCPGIMLRKWKPQQRRWKRPCRIVRLPKRLQKKPF